jgi:hypothetical protein
VIILCRGMLFKSSRPTLLVIGAPHTIFEEKSAKSKGFAVISLILRSLHTDLMGYLRKPFIGFVLNKPMFGKTTLVLTPILWTLIFMSIGCSPRRAEKREI